MKFQNHFNRAEFPRRFEKNTQPSMTVPDQAMPMREIMRRYASGLPIAAGKVPIYEDPESDLPDLTNMDLADRQEYIEKAAQELKEVKQRLDEKEAEKQKKASIAAAKKILHEEELLKSKTAVTTETK
ncbi:MAG: hypothetical protein [Microviridae sp.]|nr:MAG: hypothetical protein [Microviridae sp.]